MKWLLYRALFAAAFPLMLPGFLLRMFRRGGYRNRIFDRIGLYPRSVAERLRSHRGEWVWVHAVSVGEVGVAGQLMREWRRAEPSVRFCISTTSSTGWRTAEREATERDVLVYAPLDFPNYVKSALKTVRPRAVVLTESELWPEFVLRASAYGAPLFLVNARVSDRSAPRYRLARWWFQDVLGAFSMVFAQSGTDRDRLLAAGAPPRSVEVAGSFKFDVAARNPAKEAELSEWVFAGRRRGEVKVLLGGSTWPGEDAALLRIAKGLEGVLLVIAPRHFEKADAVESSIAAAGMKCVRRSRGEVPSGAGAEVLLADTTGELMGLYGIADVVFVGKSLCAHGAQNMIEPCLCAKSVVVGPYTENFRPVMADLVAADAIVQVGDEAELADAVRGLLADPEKARRLGERAAAAVERRRGVVPRCVREIREGLAK